MSSSFAFILFYHNTVYKFNLLKLKCFFAVFFKLFGSHSTGYKFQFGTIMQDFIKGFAVVKKSDAELGELLGVDRATVTRWRNKARFPKFDEVLKYEEQTKLPFECFISRKPNLDAIEDKLKEHLKNIKKLQKNEKNQNKEA